MAKRDIYGRSGGKVKLATKKYRNEMLEKTFEEMDAEEREKNKKKQLGARELVIIAYRKRGKKEDAYLAVKVFNEKVGTEVYTKEIVDGWILEYNKQALEKMSDEGR